MNDFNKIDLYCFSGTGNTLQASKFFAAEMKKNHIAVKIIQFPFTENEIPCEENKAVAIAFPVYAQSAPPFITDWIKNLNGNKLDTPVIVISTMASFSGLVKGPLYYLLKKKGFIPYTVKEIKMPSNFISQTLNEKKTAATIKKAETEIAEFAEKIATEKASWPYRPSLINFIHLLTVKFFIILAGFIGKRFSADESKCTKCGLCKKLCPVNNINIEVDSFPRWNNKCQQCLRCINFCEANAVSNSVIKFIYKPKYTCKNTKSSDLLD